MTGSSKSLLHFFIFRLSKKACIWRPKRQLQSSRKPYSGLPEELPHRQFSLAEIKAATCNFDQRLIIGTSCFGTVYKGIIDDGTLTVAIRRMQFSPSEFRTEVLLLCQLTHLNVESLIGFCNQKGETILVYEYLSNGSLFDWLHCKGIGNPIPWEKRLEICIGAARGLHYLHTGVKYVVMHRNVSSNTILLDHDLVPKVSGFFFSKLGPHSMSKALIKKPTSYFEGTLGYYLDPEYNETLYLSEKVDVYSFGVVLLEVVCGKIGMFHMDDHVTSLAAWASLCFRNGIDYQNIDPYLKGRIAPDCFKKFMDIAICCISDKGDERPSMGEVEVTLELALELQKKSDSEKSSI